MHWRGVDTSARDGTAAGGHMMMGQEAVPVIRNGVAGVHAGQRQLRSTAQGLRLRR